MTPAGVAGTLGDNLPRGRPMDDCVTDHLAQIERRAAVATYAWAVVDLIRKTERSKP